MKKSVIILIGIIYIMAIAMVSFFGLKTQVYEEKIYISSIEILNENVKTTSNGEKYMIVNYADGPIIIERKIYPENATKKVVEYAYDETNQIATVDQMGVVTFEGPGALTVYIMAKDGSGVITTLKIIAK